jgi:putative ABC transport system permease protein
LAGSSLTLGVRTAGDPDASLVAVREIVRAVEPELSLRYQRSMESMVADVLMPQRLGAALLSVFGLLALVLSAVGIAGVVAYAVSRQTRDIGVRIALGATKVSVLASISRGMVLPVLLGLGVGVVTARGLSRLVEGFMFGVTATDPLTYGLIFLSVLAVAVAATLLPAQRATRVNPVEALRAE